MSHHKAREIFAVDQYDTLRASSNVVSRGFRKGSRSYKLTFIRCRRIYRAGEIAQGRLSNRLIFRIFFRLNIYFI